MKLYYRPMACSFAVHVALRKAGMAPELIQYDPATGKSADGRIFAEHYRKAYVPVLIDADGEVMTEVVSLMIELDERFPQANLLPKERKARRRAIEWLAFTSAEIHKSYIADIFADIPQTEDIIAARQKVEARLNYVAERVPTDTRFLFNDELTAVDCFLLVMLLWTDHARIDIARWPQLAAYRERLMGEAPVVEAMKAEGLV